MRGSRPLKATPLVSGRHRRRRGPGVTLYEEQEARRPPPAPKGLLPSSAATWRRLWRSRVAQSWDRTSDLPVLTRYILLLDRWHRYDELVRQAPVVKGSKGQVRPHPLAARIDAIESQVRVLEEHLGLTPASRVRLGITLDDGPGELDLLMERLRSPALLAAPDASRVIDLDDYEVIDITDQNERVPRP
jgi:P27 family predicted phage terminase small subunit